MLPGASLKIISRPSGSGETADCIIKRESSNDDVKYRNIGRVALQALSSRPIVDFFTHLIASDSVTFLDFAFELVALAIDVGQVIVR
jgi:hypothetical protein